MIDVVKTLDLEYMATNPASSLRSLHASMAINNAWVDRVPVMIFAGNELDASKRRPGTEWNHSVQDPSSKAGLGGRSRFLQLQRCLLAANEQWGRLGNALVRGHGLQVVSLQGGPR